MPADYSQPGKEPYRLIEQMQVNLPSLALQERALLNLMGGPFPENNNDFHAISRVLDVACGVGTWAMEIARTYPHIEVVGITAQAAMITYAQEQAAAAGIPNVSFAVVTNTTIPHLPFPDEHFDLVNTQYLHSWLRTNEWPVFIQDCWRVTRQGGYLRMTEPERGQSTSLAFTRLEDLYLQVLHKHEQRVSPDDRHIGAANQLIRLCQETGWTETTRRAYLIDYGTKDDLADNAFQRLKLFALTFQSLILQEGLVTAEELAALQQQVHEEVEQDKFAANRFLITICSQKPVLRGEQEVSTSINTTNQGA